MASHRILYFGNDLSLLNTLSELLEDCRVVRCPDASLAQALMESEINYSLLLLDEKLPDTTGRELVCLVRGFQHRQRTPIIILSASKVEGDAAAGTEVFIHEPTNLKSLVSAVKSLLAGSRGHIRRGHIVRQATTRSKPPHC